MVTSFQGYVALKIEKNISAIFDSKTVVLKLLPLNYLLHYNEK